MLSQYLTSDRLNDHDHLLGSGDGHGVTDQPAWHRVAGRTEPHTRQLVHLPSRRAGTKLQPQRRQRAQQRLLDGQPFSRHRADLRMHRTIDLRTPGHGTCVGSSKIIKGPDKPEPRPGQHRAEHVQPSLDTPIDDQRFTRRPHPRPAAPMMITTPFRLHLRYQSPKVPRRVLIAGRRPGPPATTASPKASDIEPRASIPRDLPLPGEEPNGLSRRGLRHRVGSGLKRI